MNAEKWRQIEEISIAAIELPEVERPAFVSETCGGDENLRREVESFLAHHDDGFLEREDFERIVGSVFEREDSRLLGKKLGNYRIIREIGAGGMGAVFLAEREDGEFNQQVAIKVVRQTINEKEFVNSFRRERQILANLNHPNIARLLDGGVTDAGEPFLVMEFIEGKTLLEFAENLETAARLQLFVKICAAVSYAHQNLIVHRDIKPANILVTADGEPKLLDFGLAKISDVEPADRTQTAFHALTPAYASPEQLRGEQVTTASDVYSLGVVLYELLTGNRPFDVQTTSLEEITRRVSTDEPTKPSQAENPKSKIQNPKSLKGDLDNIALMSIRKEPERRYKSVADFAADIKRHLQGLPVSARPNTFRYQAEKFVKRNKIAVAAAALVLLAIVGGLVVALWQADVARRQRDLAHIERVKAERINQFLQQMLSFSNQSFTSISPVAQIKNVTVNEMLDEIAPRVEAELADQPDVRAQILRTIGSAYASQGIYEKAEKNYRSALATQTQIFGEENSETNETLTELGVLSYRQAKFQEANRLLEKAVAFYRKQRRENPPESSAAKLALAMDYLGIVKFYLGDAKPAFALTSEALQIAEEANLQGGERAVLSFIKSDYGGLLIITGETEKGETLLRESLAEQRQIYQTPRWETGATLLMLGISSMSKNQLAEAAAFLTEGEQIYRHTLGDKNAYLAVNLQKQAIVFSRRKDFKTAEPKARESLAMYQELFPGDKTRTGLPSAILGLVLAGDNRFGEAENYLREGVQGLEQTPVKDYLSIVQTKITLSENLLLKNRLAEAERYALEAHAEARQNLGEQNPFVTAAASIIVKIYEKQGKPELAQKYK